jgi:hypothetical protein
MRWPEEEFGTGKQPQPSGQGSYLCNCCQPGDIDTLYDMCKSIQSGIGRSDVWLSISYSGAFYFKFNCRLCSVIL